jgi:bifunctional NMN adenylyltransferase/nudix hydrolase
MPEKTGTGVIIGRFQVFQLDKSHRSLIDQVIGRHQITAVFLGTSPAPSDRNPLNFEQREQMLHEEYDDELVVYEMPDLPDDRIWSQELDRRILEQRLKGPLTIYGSQTEVLDRYSGRHATEPLEVNGHSVDEEAVWEGVVNARDFRIGIMFATLNRYPTVYPTVDIAVFRRDYREVLLARKENETRYRFPGGFTDPTDDSYEMAAIRELMEECGDVDVEELIYLGSCKIDDWRYRNSSDGVMTHLYACTLVDGEPEASDDIAEIKWFDVGRLQAELFVHEHRPLLEMLQEYLQER